MTATITEPLVHRYRPAGSAAELFRCRAPEVLLSGAAGTGKSRACLEKMHGMMLANPGARGLICRKTAVSLTSTGLVTFREIVAKEALDSGELKFYGGSRQEAASFRYGNGSTITIGGLDKSSRIMSSEYDVVFVQEATELTEDDWESITTRLRNGKVSFQQLMADANPQAPQHWLHQRCVRGKTVEIPCRHEDNPRLYDADTATWTTEGLAYLAILDGLTGVRYQRLRLGKWAAAEGLVYDEFDPAVHLFKPVGNPPHDWPRYLSVDFGYRNPFVCQWWAQSPDDTLFLYREIYMAGRLVEDHARQILAVAKKGDGHKADVWPPRAVVCDHDAEDRATLERHLGLSTVAATKNVSEGIQAVRSRLKVAGNGRPGLYICRNALVEPDKTLADAHKPHCTEDEILEYSWDPSVARLNADTAKEAPIKQNDHGLDALRYLVAEIDLVGRPRVRFLLSSGRVRRHLRRARLGRRRWGGFRRRGRGFGLVLQHGRECLDEIDDGLFGVGRQHQTFQRGDDGVGLELLSFGQEAGQHFLRSLGEPRGPRLDVCLDVVGQLHKLHRTSMDEKFSYQGHGTP